MKSGSAPWSCIKDWTRPKPLQMRRRRWPFCANIQPAREKSEPLGFVSAGNWLILMATRSDPDCSVGYYGVDIESALAEAAQIRCPTMLHLAGRDQFCPPSAQAQIHQALDTHALITLHAYPEQDHAFARPGGAHFDAQAAELAHLRTLEFFVRHLGGRLPQTRHRGCPISGMSTSSVSLRHAILRTRWQRWSKMPTSITFPC